jgi:2-furoyl-CoA dehydrogenase FAD binding subunit
VKPAPFEYVRAESVEHALDTLREHGDEAKVLAGGQSLVPALNMRLARPRVIVDLNRVPGLDGIEAENGSVRIGALVRQAAAERSPEVREACPLLAETLPYVGHFVTRNRGTVGGSIAHADAAAELSVALVALGGSIVTSRRTIAVEEFFVSHYTTALEPDELVLATTWPRVQDGQGFAFEEFALRHGDFALATVACVVVAENARIAIGAVTDRPALLQVDVGDAAEAAAAAVDPSPNLHASPEYRRSLVSVLVERALARAVGE